MSVDIERALGRIEGKLDLLIPALGRQETRLTTVSGRVSKIEKWQNRVLGAALATGFLFGIVMRALHI
jgi:hypothetical protein